MSTIVTRRMSLLVAMSVSTTGAIASPPPIFEMADLYAAGDGPFGIVAADLDGDLDLDLVVANPFGGSVSVLLNEGDGTLAEAVGYDASANARVRAVDLDADADVDLVVGSVALFNEGDGTFGAAVPLGAFSAQWVVADLDGDSAPDLAGVIPESDEVTVLLNQGDGTFAAPVTSGTGDDPQQLEAADLDGDLDLDLVVRNRGSGTVGILLNDGSGGFAGQTAYATGAEPRAMAVEDIDGDLDVDLIVANHGGRDVSILLNNGDGTFGEHTSYAAGGYPDALAVGDLDGDLDLDLVVMNDCCGPPVAVLLGDGTGVFSAPVAYGEDDVSSLSLVLRDVDQDLDLDVVIGSWSFNTGIGQVDVLLNDGAAGFDDWTAYVPGDPLVAQASCPIVVVDDLDGDGDLDLAATYTLDDSVAVLRNKGDGAFAAVANYPGFGDENLALDDLDGDGDLDLVVADNDYDIFSGSSYLRLNDGDGALGPPVPFGDAVTPYVAVVTGDLNGDGAPDLVLTVGLEGLCGGPGGVRTMLNNGDGTFAGEVALPANPCSSPAIADVDGDLHLDLVVADRTHDQIQVFLNDGEGTFGEAATYPVGDSPLSVTAGDFDGDGDLDLAVVSGGMNDVSLLPGDGEGGFGSPVVVAALSEPRAIVSADLDGDGDLDLATVGADVAVMLNDGSGTFALAGLYATGLLLADLLDVGDLDGDGDVDLVVTWSDPVYGLGIVTMLLNDGRGAFPTSVPIGLGDAFVLGDLDGDGDRELVLNAASGGVFVLTNVSCPADLDSSGDAGFSDLLRIINAWGPCGAPCPEDLNGNDDVDFADILVLIGAWGPCS